MFSRIQRARILPGVPEAPELFPRAASRDEIDGLPPREPPSKATDPDAALPMLRLSAAQTGTRHVVAAVEAPAAAPEWARCLEEIGFIPGEQVVLVARAALGGDPLVVRVGQSTFALRAAEAACVRLEARG